MDNDRASILNALIKHLDNSFLSRMASGHNLIKLATCICECDRLIELMVEADKPENTDECDRLTEQILSKIGATLQDNGKIRTMASRAGGIHTGKNPPIMDAIAVFAKRQNLSDEPSMQALVGLVKEISLVFERGRTEIIPQALDTNDADYLTAEVLEAIGQEISGDARLKEIAASTSLFLPSSLPGAIPGRPDLLTHEFFDAIAQAIQDDDYTKTVAAAAGLELVEDSAPPQSLPGIIDLNLDRVNRAGDDADTLVSEIAWEKEKLKAIEDILGQARQAINSSDSLEELLYRCTTASASVAETISKSDSDRGIARSPSKAIHHRLCYVPVVEESDSVRDEIEAIADFFCRIEGKLTLAVQTLTGSPLEASVGPLNAKCHELIDGFLGFLGDRYKPFLAVKIRTRVEAALIDDDDEVALEVPDNPPTSDAIAKAYADDGLNWPFGKLSDLILKKTQQVYGDRDDPHYPRSKATKLMLTIQGIERAIAEAKEMLPTVNKIENLGALCNSLSSCLADLVEKLRSHPSNVQPRSLSGIIALRINVRTLFESIVDTIAKCLKFIPPLLHPVLEDKPPPLNLI